MNIFYLDKKTDKCVRYYFDSHVRKMILESAQMLCTAHWQSGGEAPYKPTHKNHPCTRWVCNNRSNYFWLVALGLALCDEFEYRFGKTHKTRQVLDWLKSNLPNIPIGNFENPPQAMPDEYKNSDTAIAYKTYYANGKKHLLHYTKRRRPHWINKFSF